MNITEDILNKYMNRVHHNIWEMKLLKHDYKIHVSKGGGGWEVSVGYGKLTGGGLTISNIKKKGELLSLLHCLKHKQ